MLPRTVFTFPYREAEQAKATEEMLNRLLMLPISQGRAYTDATVQRDSDEFNHVCSNSSA